MMMIKKEILESVIILLMTLSIILSSYLSFRIPGIESVAPVTAQTLILSLLVYYFSKRKVLLSIGFFIILGILGFPVFAEGKSGFDILLGNSGGFIYGFFMSALLMKNIHEGLKLNFLSRISYFSLFTIYVLLFGFIHLSFKIGFINSWQYGIKPFLIGAAVKIFLALLIVEIWARINKNRAKDLS